MKQPTKNSKIKRNKTINKKNKVFKIKEFKKSIEASELDGSGLETYFRKKILDKLNVRYEQQFEAKSIGRFFDFYLPDHRLILECDGDYFHQNPNVYNKPINKMQKYNKKIDEVKDKWALINGYILLRFWEKDIYNNTKKIIDLLSERINSQEKVVLLEKSKKDGSFFMKKK